MKKEIRQYTERFLENIDPKLLESIDSVTRNLGLLVSNRQIVDSKEFSLDNRISKLYLKAAINVLSTNQYFLISNFHEELIRFQPPKAKELTKYILNEIVEVVLNSEEVSFLDSLSRSSSTLDELLKIYETLNDKSLFYHIFSIYDDQIELNFTLLKDDEIKEIDLKNLPKIVAFHISNYIELSNIKSKIKNHIKYLYIEEGDLENIPHAVLDFKNLKFLSLKKNKIEFNHEDLLITNQLKQLVGLDLSHNYLENYYYLLKLNNIEVLDITFNPKLPYEDISLTNSLELVKIGPVSQIVSDSLSQRFQIKEFDSLLKIYPFLEPYSIIENRKTLYKRVKGAILSLSKK